MGLILADWWFEVGNPNLNSETSNNFDITFNFDNGDFYGYASFMSLMWITISHS